MIDFFIVKLKLTDYLVNFQIKSDANNKNIALTKLKTLSRLIFEYDS